MQLSTNQAPSYEVQRFAPKEPLGTDARMVHKSQIFGR